jgi:hypothetical protein
MANTPYASARQRTPVMSNVAVPDELAAMHQLGELNNKPTEMSV